MKKWQSWDSNLGCLAGGPARLATGTVEKLEMENCGGSQRKVLLRIDTASHFAFNCSVLRRLSSEGGSHAASAETGPASWGLFPKCPGCLRNAEVLRVWKVGREGLVISTVTSRGCGQHPPRPDRWAWPRTALLYSLSLLSIYDDPKGFQSHDLNWPKQAAIISSYILNSNDHFRILSRLPCKSEENEMK